MSNFLLAWGRAAAQPPLGAASSLESRLLPWAGVVSGGPARGGRLHVIFSPFFLSRALDIFSPELHRLMISMMAQYIIQKKGCDRSIHGWLFLTPQGWAFPLFFFGGLPPPTPVPTAGSH